MAPSMMRTTDHPNLSQWSIETGYNKETNLLEYPVRSFTTGERAGLQIYLNENLGSFNAWCKEIIEGYIIIIRLH